MTAGPLILGSTGRVGQAFRALSAAGRWPGPDPLWHGRRGCDLWPWDMREAPPALPGSPTGIILLAGVTAGDGLAQNSALALAALALARRSGCWPLLVCSSGAVYGRATGPVGESSPAVAPNPYGQAKRAMEDALHHALRPGDRVTCLRLANVAGCDQLFAAMARGPVALDRFADDRAPRRSYVGPLTLARLMTRLIALDRAGTALPFLLNLAQSGTVGMDAIATAAGAAWHPVPAPASALAALELDTRRLATLVTVPPANAEGLVAEARAAGWAPA